MPIQRIFYLVVSICLLSACAVGPDHQTPAVAVPAQWHEPVAGKTDSAGVDLRQWWKGFNDPLLNRLVDMALQNNLDLRAAEARLNAARAQTVAISAERMPQMRALGTYERIGFRNTMIPASQGQEPINVKPFNLLLGGFDMSWELDIFGGVKRRKETAEANADAQQENRRDLSVTLTAEVARQYLSVIALQQQLDTARQRLDTVREQLRLAEGLYDAGIAPATDVQAQRAMLASVEAAVPALDEQIKIQRHSLAVLLGLNPTDLEQRLGHLSTELPQPPNIPVGLPSDLLRRRPDIRQAEYSVASASAAIGAAVAELFPKITFSGVAGFQSQDLGRFSNLSGGFYGFGPRISVPIFQAGRLLANIDYQEEQHRESLITYQKTVLNAFREVEDQLVSINNETQRRQSLEFALGNAQIAEVSSLSLYQEGETELQAALQSRRNRQDAQDSMVQSRLAWITHHVALYKALGGGWNADGS